MPLVFVGFRVQGSSEGRRFSFNLVLQYPTFNLLGLLN